MPYSPVISTETESSVFLKRPPEEKYGDRNRYRLPEDFHLPDKLDVTVVGTEKPVPRKKRPKRSYSKISYIELKVNPTKLPAKREAKKIPHHETKKEFHIPVHTFQSYSLSNNKEPPHKTSSPMEDDGDEDSRPDIEVSNNKTSREDRHVHRSKSSRHDTGVSNDKSNEDRHVSRSKSSRHATGVSNDKSNEDRHVSRSKSSRHDADSSKNKDGAKEKVEITNEESFLNSLLPTLKRMTFTQMEEFKERALRIICEILCE